MRQVVSCGDDGTIKFWDVEKTTEGKALRTLKFKSKTRKAGHQTSKPAKNNKAVPILSVLVGGSFVVGARADGSLVGFTFLSSWPLASAHRATNQRESNSATSPGHHHNHHHQQQHGPHVSQRGAEGPGSCAGDGVGEVSVALAPPAATPQGGARKGGGSKSSAKSRRNKGRAAFHVPRDDDLLEMRFDDAFDEYDLQQMHDFHNGYLS